MTDAIKMAEMQRANIEFERQRHLANWLIKSSAHMANPTTSSSPAMPPQKTSSTITATPPTKTGTISQNPMFFMGSSQKTASHNLSKQSIFTSQTNLPLQILTSSQDGHKPKLRRFNSHDTSANMFSVVDFENARLARRNDVERQKYKMNSLSSGGDCSTGDSKGSKFSSESNPEPLPANVFLERYALPRVLRIKTGCKFNTLLSSSSNDSSLSDKKSASDTSAGGNEIAGELFLAYRHLKSRSIYHGYNSKHGSSKKKGLKIPQEYQGFFSLLTDRGTPTATMYTTIIQLVRERVYKFISVDNMTAYTETTTDAFPRKSHYVKGTARAGQVFRLLAVFQDGVSTQDASNSLISQKDTLNSNSSGREKERGRYAQLLGDNRQVVYVSLSVKGKFYEIEQSIPQILQRSSSLGKPPVVKKFNPDCIHHISDLITNETELPIQLKFISGPSGCGHAVPEHFTITRVSTENVLIACPIDEVENRTPLYLRKLYITPEVVLTKCYLGFENEQRMFANQNVQNLLKFCQFNSDNFQRLIEVEPISRDHINGSSGALISAGARPEKSSDGLKILRPLNIAKFLHRDKMSSAHEKEDSIIFLSKNDLDNLEIQQQQKQLRHEEIVDVDQQTISDKMKVFQPHTKKKWFKNFKNSSKMNSYSSLEFDTEAKRRSVDRYQDMSKLLQERFGGNVSYDSATTSRPSSDLGVSSEARTNLVKKSVSLQDVVKFKSIKNEPLPDTPDLLKIEQKLDKIESSQAEEDETPLVMADGDDGEDDENEISVVSTQQSFISQKLYSEFHVKTKQHSKSSSNLHQLLHFAVPQKMAVNETKKTKPNVSFPKLQMSIAAPHRTTSVHSVEDDLPYSNVRDSLVQDSQCETPTTPSENIYSEICTDFIENTPRVATPVTSIAETPTMSIVRTSAPPRHTSLSGNDRRAFGSIRISISNNDHQFHHVSNHQSTVVIPSDGGGFYNSIK